ncbi:hypothetical protein, partial [Staphylococcus warneri]|uniref:hypothetical protein n=1 Tax=Staphylococcus warneri TaxID=1292 RepID=UPI001C977AD1
LTNTHILTLQQHHDQLSNLIKHLPHILHHHHPLLNLIKNQLTQITNKFKTHPLSTIQPQISQIKIHKELILPTEQLL